MLKIVLVFYSTASALAIEKLQKQKSKLHVNKKVHNGIFVYPLLLNGSGEGHRPIWYLPRLEYTAATNQEYCMENV